jgi:hypothetical protein
MTTATIILNVISECFAMKQADVFVKRHLVKDVHRMRLAEGKECAYLRQPYQLMVPANKYCHNQIIAWSCLCTKLIWLKLIQIYLSIKVTLKRFVDQDS